MMADALRQFNIIGTVQIANREVQVTLHAYDRIGGEFSITEKQKLSPPLTRNIFYIKTRVLYIIYLYYHPDLETLPGALSFTSHTVDQAPDSFFNDPRIQQLIQQTTYKLINNIEHQSTLAQ